MAATAAVYNRLANSSLGCAGNSSLLASHGGHHNQLARSLERILEEALLSGELNLSNRKLKEFPKTGTKYMLDDTVIADLSRNRFCELPEEITTFSFLETLLLYHNTIRTIPESVKHLTSLTYLDLRSNQLSTLPREICFLPLQVLLISNNRLTLLPDELGRMDRLTDLDASYNQLTALPTRIGELRSLRSLSLRNNQLMYLPRELHCLTLVSLDVSSNRIASLPLEIRHMSTLVEINLENNPLTSPPASLCVRGLVHVFKFLETQAVKDEKGSRAGGNYDGYTTLRRAPRHNSSAGLLESNRVPRHPVDSGYSTCDGIDKRWSHDSPNANSKNGSPARRAPTTLSALSTEHMDASLTSSSSTIVDESISLSGTLNAAIVKPLQSDLLCSPTRSLGSANSDLSPSKSLQEQNATLHKHINYAASTSSSSSNGSSPDQDDILIDHHNHHQSQTANDQNSSKNLDDKQSKNLGNIQTYREYKEAMKQKHNQEISSVYKIKNQNQRLYDMSEASNALNTNNSANALDNNESVEVRFNNVAEPPLPKSIIKNSSFRLNGLNGSLNSPSNGDDNIVIPKKPIQKVIPSRNTEVGANSPSANQQATNYTNGDCSGGSGGGYVKPNSPMKTPNGVAGNGILTNNNNNNNNHRNGALKSPNGSNQSGKLSSAKTTRTVTWNHDIPAEKLSFTMRREFDRQREETELMSQLRSIIETRLKMTLPEDIASALTDGVILCHLANYVRPRSVASIHVPSPGVSKLTMARCRRNVDNFLEACRKIGVDEELICSCADIVPSSDGNALLHNNNNNNNNNNNDCHIDKGKINHADADDSDEERKTLPNPSAVLKTLAALIAMDSNPNHQNLRSLTERKQQQQQTQQMYNHNNGDNHYDQGNNYHCNRQEQEQQLTTATFTKEQMMQQQNDDDEEEEEDEEQLLERQHQQGIFTNMEFNSEYEIANHHNKDDVDHVNGYHHHHHHQHNDGIDDDYASEVVVKREHKLKRSTKLKAVNNFLSQTSFKTFQTIKLNLITSHGNTGNNQNKEHLATLSTTATLQTIVEAENDMINGHNGGLNGDMMAAGMDNDDGTMHGQQLCSSNENMDYSGKYHLINEKSFNGSSSEYQENQKQNDNNKYKTNNPIDGGDDTKKGNSISKRIEFFEHNKKIIKASPILTVPLCTSNTIEKFQCNKTLNNKIFSIYNTDSDQNMGKITSSTKKDAASSTNLLKHDSYVLTIILSCIFMVTFLLLVFFPIPS